ncbi:MAG TPA: nucleotidyltransferase family protein [Arachnia sp.]|nr:nucleotidyltransferase family protein [Arachnia sp.]HMR14312.1 nucleotidyltransferase family protein [Arachnia sp.]
MTYGAPTKAVILARGLGSRMRKDADGVALTSEQAKAADSGVKAMISVGRPFLDHVVSALADAGFADVCLVIGPEHDVIRDYYDALPKTRVNVAYAVQEEPLGTANAVLAAEDFAGDDRVLVINSDNYYPAAALRLLADVPGSALVGFTREGLLTRSNIAPEKIAAFALATADADGNLAELVEKPDAATALRLGPDAVVSMNCWLCGPAIFDAARAIPRSTRGEYEITDAVRAAIAAGDPYALVVSEDGVLDMSARDDIASVAAALGDREVLL